MEVMCRVGTLTWSQSISPCLHSSAKPFSRCETKKFRVLCASDRTQKMTVSVTGATGFIGRKLVQRLQEDNHQVRVLTRSRSKAELIFPDKLFPGIMIAEEPLWRDCIQGSTAVVNLAGMPISTRWSSEVKKEVKESRIRVTSKELVKPKYLMRAAHQEMITWLRFSWIHLDDIVNLIDEALSNPSYQGVINGTAPNPVRLAEMCEHLGNALGRPSWLPVPDFILKAVLGEGATVVLEGQKVVPARAEELGFPFKYRYVKDALKAVLS